MIIFIDSSAYIAYYNKRDRNHNKAVSLIKRTRDGELGPIINGNYSTNMFYSLFEF